MQKEQPIFNVLFIRNEQSNVYDTYPYCFFYEKEKAINLVKQANNDPDDSFKFVLIEKCYPNTLYGRQETIKESKQDYQFWFEWDQENNEYKELDAAPLGLRSVVCISYS